MVFIGYYNCLPLDYILPLCFDVWFCDGCILGLFKFCNDLYFRELIVLTLRGLLAIGEFFGILIHCFKCCGNDWLAWGLRCSYCFLCAGLDLFVTLGIAEIWEL